jgi:hypothetical protein
MTEGVTTSVILSGCDICKGVLEKSLAVRMSRRGPYVMNRSYGTVKFSERIGFQDLQ